MKAVRALPWTARVSLLLLALTIATLNVFGRRDLPEDPFLRAVLLREAWLPERVERALEEALAIRPLHLEVNRLYVINHYDIAPDRGRDDRALEERYLSLAAEPAAADLAHFCLGLARSLEGRHQEALRLYRQVTDERLRYLNGSLAAAYLALGDVAQAEEHYWREIDFGGDLREAVPELARLYLEQGRLEEAAALEADERLSSYVHAGIRRELSLRTGDWTTYFRIVFLEPLRHVRPGAAIGALIICGMWLAFLRRIDVFDQEPPALTALALMLGALCAEASLVLTDVLVPVLGSWPTEVRSLAHSVIGIGVVEEVAKLVPLLLMAGVWRQDDEPIDLLIYGSLSALGFATLENALYFTGYGLDIAFSRFIISTVLHLSMTGLVAYAWGRARFMRRVAVGPRVVGALALAAVLHGLFNHFLMGTGLALLSLLIGTGLAVAYGNMIANSLSFSPYFRRSETGGGRLRNLGLLVGTAALLVLISFLYAHYSYGTEVANRKLLSSAGSTMLSVVVVFGSLGEITVTQGIAVPLLRATWRRRFRTRR